ncbi:MAG: SRPBCC family protein [Clostridiales bacterium]|nr:SRPBCC family protein [Clostridiales bacterium]
MVVSTMKAIFQNDVQKVWDTVLAVENYTWRSDLSKVEVVSEKQFIEYTKAGYPTTFTITDIEPYERWEFDMENTNMKGHWIGIFTSKGKQTEIEFTESVTAKKFFTKPFVKFYLKKQQVQFVSDLEKMLLR